MRWGGSISGILSSSIILYSWSFLFLNPPYSILFSPLLLFKFSFLFSSFSPVFLFCSFRKLVTSFIVLRSGTENIQNIVFSGIWDWSVQWDLGLKIYKTLCRVGSGTENIQNIVYSRICDWKYTKQCVQWDLGLKIYKTLWTEGSGMENIQNIVYRGTRLTVE